MPGIGKTASKNINTAATLAQCIILSSLFPSRWVTIFHFITSLLELTTKQNKEEVAVTYFGSLSYLASSIIFILWVLSGGGGGENASFVQLLFSRQLSSFFLSVSSPYERYIRAQLLQVPSSTKLDPNPLFSREQLYEIENYRDHFPPNISLILRRP